LSTASIPADKKQQDESEITFTAALYQYNHWGYFDEHYMNDYFDLGNYNRNITTSSESAQTWFNRGLIWCYGFNQEEGVR
jgi:hypothetical protein